MRTRIIKRPKHYPKNFFNRYHLEVWYQPDNYRLHDSYFFLFFAKREAKKIAAITENEYYSHAEVIAEYKN